MTGFKCEVKCPIFKNANLPKKSLICKRSPFPAKKGAFLQEFEGRWANPPLCNFRILVI